MTRALVSLLVILPGCRQTFVAAQAADGGGSGTAGSQGDSDADSGSGTAATGIASDNQSASGSGSAEDCVLPEPTEVNCDAFEDPLRALEVACLPSVASATFQSSDAAAWRSTREFGNAFWVGAASEKILLLSTGQLPLANDAGQVVVEESGAQVSAVDNANPLAMTLPAPVSTASGSAGGAGGSPYFDCDGVGDCSETLPALWTGAGAVDLLWFSFQLTVPDDVHAFEVDLAFFTAEFPESIGGGNQDAFVLWSSSAAFTGNVATFEGQPLTVAGVAGLLAENSLSHPSLLRTGFDGGTAEPCTIAGDPYASCPIGANTGWLTLAAPVVPGEVVTIVGALFEQSTGGRETAVVLDGFRWRCDSCSPGRDCGLRTRDG